MASVSVVTGANSGIGRAVAIHLASEGHEVYGTVRSLDKATKLQDMAAARGVTVNLVELDVADDDSVRDGMAEVLSKAGRVDVLVNNAGVGGNATVEDCTTAEMLDVLNVNVCGGLRCLQAVLPGMRERRSGSIVNITSIAGRVAAVAQASYVASKWAFEGLSEQLAHELAPFGIRVVIVEPGVTKSAIFAKNVDLPNTTGVYDAAYARMFQMYATGIEHATDPFEVGRVIHEAVTAEDPKLRYRVSWGGDELVLGRQRITDEEWVALGAVTDDAAYYDRFAELFNLDIRP